MLESDEGPAGRWLWPANIRRAFLLLSASQRRHWLLLLPLGLVCALIEAATAASLFALVAVLSGSSRLAALPVLGSIYPYLPPSLKGEASLIKLFLGVTAALVVLRVVFAGVTVAFNHLVIAKDRAELSARLYEGYLNAPYSFHLERNAADCVYRVNDSINTLFGSVLGGATTLLTHAMTIAGVSAVLLAASPWVTIVSVVLLAAWLLLITRLMTRWQMSFGRRADELHRCREKVLWEGLGAIKEIKVLGRERYFSAAYAGYLRELVQIQFRGALRSAAPRLLVEGAFALVMLVAAVLLLGERTDRSLVLPVLGLYAYAGVRLIPMANAMIEMINQITAATIPLRRLSEDCALMEVHPIDEGREEILSANGDTRKTECSGKWRSQRIDGIEFENVSFTYARSPRPAVSRLSFSLRSGECIALAGKTGAGKSTVLDLVAGLLEACEGRVLIHGHGLRKQRNPRSALGSIGYVPQTITLTDDSVRGNVAMGIATERVDDTAVRRALRAACLEDVIARLPAGIATPVGQRGVRLSGGEIQRLALARALYHRPSLLILDEATSALDAATEKKLIHSLKDPREHRTIVLATHRAAVMAACDRVIFLRDGELAASGEFERLLELSPDFNEMMSRQGPNENESRGAHHARNT